MLVPPLHEGLRRPEPEGAVDANYPASPVEWLRILAAWGYFAQVTAFALACAGESGGGAVFALAGMVFVSAIISAGLAAALAIYNWRELPTISIVGGTLPWFLVCAEATLVLGLFGFF